jgi:uncharacterized protein YegP (UPF0339 family)
MAHPILVRVDVAGEPATVETHPDPRATRSTMREGLGHYFGVAEQGILNVSVPFASVTDLANVRIRLTDLSGIELAERDATTLERLLDRPTPEMRTVYEVNSTDLYAAPDWPDVARPLGIPADAGRFEIYLDVQRRYRWRLRRTSGEIVADSGQGYDNRHQCEADLAWVRAHAAIAPVTALDTSPG